MNSTNSKIGKNEQPKNGKTNDIDFEHELAEAQQRIKEQEDEIKKYANLVKKNKDEISTLKEFETKIKEQENDLDQSLQEIENLEKQNDELTSKNKEAQVELQKAQNENDRLKEKLKKEQEKDLEIREIEKEKIQLDKKVNELKQIIKSLEDRISANEKLIPVEPEENGVGILFRIHFYKRQEVFNGRIEHPISKSSKAFAGIDQDAIIEFITDHLPKPEEPAKATEPVPSGLERKTVPVDMVVANRVGQANQPLRIKLEFDLSHVSIGQKFPITCTMSIFARLIQGGPKQMIAEAIRTLKSAEAFAVDMETKSLPRGTYNLETVVTSKLPSGMPAPFNYFSKGGIVHVN